jgi:hypothetical protein
MLYLSIVYPKQMGALVVYRITPIPVMVVEDSSALAVLLECLVIEVTTMITFNGGLPHLGGLPCCDALSRMLKEAATYSVLWRFMLSTPCLRRYATHKASDCITHSSPFVY